MPDTDATTEAHPPEPEITADAIMAAAAAFFTVSIEDLRGPRKAKALAQARQIAMYLCRELTHLSLPAIGRAFGGRHHTTVLHAEKKIRASITELPRIHHQVHELSARIIQRTGRQEARR